MQIPGLGDPQPDGDRGVPAADKMQPKQRLGWLQLGASGGGEIRVFGAILWRKQRSAGSVRPNFDNQVKLVDLCGTNRRLSR
jgi:hypothetical protein